jgi:ATP-binding cassette, subfamily B, bacterial MsbA
VATLELWLASRRAGHHGSGRGQYASFLPLNVSMVNQFGRLSDLWSRDGDARLVYRVLVQYGLVHWRNYATAFILMAISAGSTAAAAYLLGPAVNAIYSDKDLLALLVLCVATVVLFCAKGIAAYGQAVLLARISNRITAENQLRIFDKLIQEGIGYFADRHSSDFTARALYGGSAVGSVLSQLVLALGRDIMSLIALFAVMVMQNPMMSLIGVLVMPPAVFGVRKLIRRVKSIATLQFAKGAHILQVMQDTAQGFRVVKAFNLEDAMRQRIAQDIDSVEQAANKMARVSNRSSPLMETLGGCAIALVVAYGGYQALETGAAPGQFVSFIGAFLLAYEPAKRVARLNIDLGSGLVGVRVLFDLLDSPPAEGNDSSKPALRVAEGLIEFTEVVFSYRAGEPVLRSMCFIAEPRSVTALVGSSGGGKSTIFNLLLGFYVADSGTITIDGRDIADASRRSLRANIAYVGQEPFLFRGSIRDNILCGMPSATEAQTVAAAKAAFAHDFIMSFPLGYDTQVGEFGSQLSLGQRQRVAVARAFIKNAPFVLLDEPTSALDSESEHKVQEAIRHLCAGKTTLVIAHRLSTITHADCIHVVESGMIVESGQHDVLLRKGGRYATFFHQQFPGGKTSSAAPGLEAHGSGQDTRRIGVRLPAGTKTDIPL